MVALANLPPLYRRIQLHLPILPEDVRQQDRGDDEHDEDEEW